MGESELKIALQREGDSNIREFWQLAEAAVSTRREEIEAELAQLREETDRKFRAQASVLRSNLLFEAQTRAQECCLHTEAALELRLKSLAQQLLPELAGDRANLWQRLRNELPDTAWATLTAHPEDLALARADFPVTEIILDETLGGGMVATDTGGVFRIDNSLRCRLQRAWPDLLPELMIELHKQVDNDETA